MKKTAKNKLLETDLYQPVYDFFSEQGYTVRSEVKNCDITAVKEDELIVVELKCSFNASLLIQATQRQKAADLVYVALPRPKGSIYRGNWNGILHLLRRLELGLIFVSFSKADPGVEIVFHPVPFDRGKSIQRSKKVRHGILKEIEGRYGDYNTGGSCRRKLMTAYRERAVFIACCIEKYGPISPSKLRNLGSGPKTQSILSKNFYGWFKKVERGKYELTEAGKSCLEEYSELVEHFLNEIETTEHKN